MTERGLPEGLNRVITQLDQHKVASARAEKERREFDAARKELIDKAERVLQEKGLRVPRSVGLGAGPGIMGHRRETISVLESPTVDFESDGRKATLQLRQTVRAFPGYQWEFDGFSLSLQYGKKNYSMSVGRVGSENFFGEPIGMDDIAQAGELVDYIDGQLSSTQTSPLPPAQA